MDSIAPPRGTYEPDRQRREREAVPFASTSTPTPAASAGGASSHRDRGALLVIDMQNYTCHREGGLVVSTHGDLTPEEPAYFWTRLERTVIPNLGETIALCRRGGLEVIFTVIECLTRDCRDNSRDYDISGLRVPKGSWDAKVVDQIAPGDDDIVLPKTSCNIFTSTNIDYVLRSLGVTHLLVAGALTDQCVESCVRTACDFHYHVTLLEDCCITHSAERHAAALASMRGFCRIRTTKEVASECMES